MSATIDGWTSTMQHRVNAEIQDDLDENLELGLEDSDLADVLADGHTLPDDSAFPRRLYFTELLRLQRELIKLQARVVAKKLKLVVIFEGRDATGKGGIIKRVTQRLNPRVCRAVALPVPTERERTQWYFQRYVPHLPAGGEIVLFDRSWYNRAGVEHVMGFCTEAGYEDFFGSAPEFERLLVRSGIVLVKYLALDHRRRAEPALPDADQRSVEAVEALADGHRVAPPLGSLYQRERGDVRAHPHRGGAVVGGDDKKRARLNCIAHLLTRVPYEDVPHEKPTLPAREHDPDYHPKPTPPEMIVPDHYADIVPEKGK